MALAVAAQPHALSRRRAAAVAGGLLLAAAAAAPAADPAPVVSLADGRAGAIRFESVTPSGYFQLARRESMPKTTIAGTLRLPAGADRVAAMVVAHGSAGVNEEREGWWAERLGEAGFATFVVDSFGPRGVRQTATDQGQLSTAANVADALAALALLTTHPRVDPARIGVIGFSKGGQVALYTALEPFRRAVGHEATRFAAHVALYPYCSDWYVAEAAGTATCGSISIASPSRCAQQVRTSPARRRATGAPA